MPSRRGNPPLRIPRRVKGLIPMTRHCSALLVICLSTVASLAARGQSAPVKPGLWEVHIDRTVDGKRPPDLSERLKNMPPERRQQMEAMMKERGSEPGGGTMKV